MRSTGSSTTYRKSSIKPPEDLFISSPFEWEWGGGGRVWGLIEAGGLFSLDRSRLIGLEKTVVS